jgi:hypothetical protein
MECRAVRSDAVNPFPSARSLSAFSAVSAVITLFSSVLSVPLR